MALDSMQTVGPAAQGGIRPGARPHPQAVTDQLDIHNVSAPTVATPGDIIEIAVEVGCRAPLFTNCETYVEIAGGGQTKRIPPGGSRDMSEGTRDTFRDELEMPAEGNMTVTIEAYDYGDATGSPNLEASTSVIVESAGATERTLRNWGPWLVGGGAIGAGGAHFLDENIYSGAALGAGAGLASKVATDQLGGGLGGIIDVSNDLLRSAAWIGAGAGAGFALGELTDLPTVPAVVGGGGVGFGAGQLAGGDIPLIPLALAAVALGGLGLVATGAADVLPDIPSLPGSSGGSGSGPRRIPSRATGSR